MTNTAHARLAAELRSRGALAVPNFMEQQLCDQVRARLESIVQSLLQKPLPYEDDGFVVKTSTSDYRGLRAPHALSASLKPVMNIRDTKEDRGMIDIFRADLLFPEIFSSVCTCPVKGIISEAAGEPVSIQGFNVYINKGISDTRGFHYDTHFDLFKFFVYLTDVVDEDDGPYCYALGSNQPAEVRRNVEIVKERGLSYGDVLDLSNERIVKYTAPRGTLVISNQCGAHRGHPQAAGRYRAALVFTAVPNTIVNSMGKQCGFVFPTT